MTPEHSQHNTLNQHTEPSAQIRKAPDIEAGTVAARVQALYDAHEHPDRRLQAPTELKAMPHSRTHPLLKSNTIFAKDPDRRLVANSSDDRPATPHYIGKIHLGSDSSDPFVSRSTSRADPWRRAESFYSSQSSRPANLKGASGGQNLDAVEPKRVRGTDSLDPAVGPKKQYTSQSLTSSGIILAEVGATAKDQDTKRVDGDVAAKNVSSMLGEAMRSGFGNGHEMVQPTPHGFERRFAEASDSLSDRMPFSVAVSPRAMSEVDPVSETSFMMKDDTISGEANRDDFPSESSTSHERNSVRVPASPVVISRSLPARLPTEFYQDSDLRQHYPNEGMPSVSHSRLSAVPTISSFASIGNRLRTRSLNTIRKSSKHVQVVYHQLPSPYHDHLTFSIKQPKRNGPASLSKVPISSRPSSGNEGPSLDSSYDRNILIGTATVEERGRPDSKLKTSASLPAIKLRRGLLPTSQFNSSNGIPVLKSDLLSRIAVQEGYVTAVGIEKKRKWSWWRWKWVEADDRVPEADIESTEVEGSDEAEIQVQEVANNSGSVSAESGDRARNIEGCREMAGNDSEAASENSEQGIRGSATQAGDGLESMTESKSRAASLAREKSVAGKQESHRGSHDRDERRRTGTGNRNDFIQGVKVIISLNGGGDLVVEARMETGDNNGSEDP